ncbi:ABC transporter permease [Clostridium senegalense]
MIFNIAKNNVKMNLKNYIVYLVSIIVSVSIFFIFKSLEFNETINGILQESVKLSTGFKMSSYIILFFSGMFIWYSNNFFLKKRKKEIGLYSLLGIENESIGRMLFLETFFIGIIALVIGILLGAIFAKFATIVLIKMIGLSIPIGKVITSKGIINTIIAFIIIFILVSIISGRTIYKFELIDLFKAESKREVEPKASMIKAVLSIILILFGYLNYLNLINSSNAELSLIVILISITVGTFMLFSSLLIFLIKARKRNKTSYFKGLNMIVTSKLLFRIKGNSRALALIAILSATTITAMGVSISYYDKFIGKFNDMYPYSYMTSIDSKSLDRDITKFIQEENNTKFLGSTKAEYVEVEGEVDLQQSNLNVMSESDFDKINNLREKKYENIDLKPGECLYFYEFGDSASNKEEPKEINITNDNINFENYTIKKYYKNNLINEHMSFETIILNDKDYNEVRKIGELQKLNIYQLSDNKNIEMLDKKINDAVNEEVLKNKDDRSDIFIYSSYYENFKEQSTSISGMLFIGIFVGGVFLVAMGSIIFFKQISEATEESGRYKSLRKIGVSEKSIKSTIYKEVAYVFIIPLIVGIVHSAVAISYIAKAFNQNTALIELQVLIPYIVIYMIYYIITSKNYYKIISETE